MYPNVVVHYGISNRLEVNTEMSIVTAIDKSVSPQQNTTGIEPVLIGSNYQLVHDTGYIPSVIIATQLGIPFFKYSLNVKTRDPLLSIATRLTLTIRRPSSCISILPSMSWQTFHLFLPALLQD